jgi:hypothetical protein
MSRYLLTIASIMALMLIAILVDRLYKHFAYRYPELGPFRSEGCSSGGCGGGSCSSKRSDSGSCGAHHD